MEPSVHGQQRRRRQVRVDLGGRDVGVAEHGLDRAQVGAALEQMARERVPEDVGRDALAQARLGGGATHDRPERLPREAPPARVHEQAAAVADAGIQRADVPEVTAHPLRGFAADRHETLLSPLAHADHVARAQVDVIEGEAQTLGRAHAGRVEQLEHRAIPHAAWPIEIGRLDERRDDLAGERAWKRARPPRRLEILGGIAAQLALANEMLVEAAERGDAPRDAGRAQPARSQPREIPDDVVGAGAAETTMLSVQELREVGEIAAVGTESISGGPPLCLEGAEILDYDIGHRVTTSDSITTLDNREGRARREGASSLAPRQLLLSRARRR